MQLKILENLLFCQNFQLHFFFLKNIGSFFYEFFKRFLNSKIKPKVIIKEKKFKREISKSFIELVVLKNSKISKIMLLVVIDIIFLL